MAELLLGSPVSLALDSETKHRADALISREIVPTLAIVRVGENVADISYERAASKKASVLGINAVLHTLPADTDAESFLDLISRLNSDDAVHAVLILRPLPQHLESCSYTKLLCPSKDIDGISPAMMSALYSGTKPYFAPCTARACMEILSYYKIALKGAKVAVIGRSLVVGRPLAMLLMHENATVTICHSKTADLISVCKSSDIVVSAIGKPEFLDGQYFSAGQSVIDVGVSFCDANNKLCGDIDLDSVLDIVKAVTPFKGGVGSVTASVLARQVIEACEDINSL